MHIRTGQSNMVGNRRATIGSTSTITTFAIITTEIIATAIMTTMIMMPSLFTTVIAQLGNSTDVQQDTEFRVQNTTMSIPAPNANINN
jgi:hypothetical protein